MARLPSIQALQAFEATARRLSVKHAAAELHLTAGAVSRQVQTLEGQLGVALFRRGHRKLDLTPAGESYLAEIAPPLAALQAAGERLRAGAVAPAVAIVAYPTFAVRWLIPRWGRFLDAHPEIDLSLTTSLNPMDFVAGDADLAIRVARAGDEGAPRLMDVDLFPVAAPAVAARLTDAAGLADETLLHGTPRPDDWPRWLASAGVQGVDGRRGLRFESLNLAYQAAIEGLGVAIGFGGLVADDLDAGRLAQPFAHVRRSGRAICLAKTGRRPETPEVRVVRDWLLAEAAVSSARSAASAGSAP